jgi:hypothetical protein
MRDLMRRLERLEDAANVRAESCLPCELARLDGPTQCDGASCGRGLAAILSGMTEAQCAS